MGKLNLCELLKGHEGEAFYSPLFGEVIYTGLIFSDAAIVVKDNHGENRCFYSDGKFISYREAEIMFFPSKDQRDWNKWVEEQKPKVPKTWSELVEQDKFKDILIRAGVNNVPKGEQVYLEVTAFDLPIEKSALALLKIHQLIEVGYGGNVKREEESYHTAGIDNNLNIIISEECDEDIIVFHPLIFHNSEQAAEFLSCPENVQLIKDFYMIP